MRDLRGLRRVVAAAVVGAALLTGCSEKQPASETLPSSSAAETSEALPEIGPADFPVPDEARTKDAAGAEAFLRYWIDLMNHLRPIPAGQPLRELGPDCQECLRIARVYDEASAAGRRFDGGDLGLESIGAPVVEGDEAVINFFARQEAIALLDPDGAVVESLPPGSRLGSGMTLLWSDVSTSWVVTSFTLG